jgi:hypothetical protein
MCLQILFGFGCIVTFGTGKGFLSCVVHVVYLQLSICSKCSVCAQVSVQPTLCQCALS